MLLRARFWKWVENCISTTWVLTNNAASCAPMLIDQIRISGGVAQASSLLRSNFWCFWSTLSSEAYCLHVWSMYETESTCTLKFHELVHKLYFSLENWLRFQSVRLIPPFNTTNCLHFGAQIPEDIIKAIPSLKAYFKSSLHSISYNYMACLFVGPFSNTKWNVTLNSIIVNYKNYLLWKMKSGHTSGNPTNSKLPVYKNVF